MSEWLTTAEAAEILKVSVDVVERLRRRGELRWFRLVGTRVVRMKRSDVEALLEERLGPPAPRRRTSVRG